nr:alpha/beta fold hydrolase [Streptomyces roseifaciens]
MSETTKTLQHRFDGPEDAPVLVLGPSLGTTWHMWDRQIPELTRHWRVLRFDLPGHGGAPAAPAATVDDLGDRLVATLDSLGVDRFGYAGCSLSAAVGIDLALRHPHRLASLALVAASARYGTADSWRQRGAGVRRDGLDPVARSAPERWFTANFSGAQPAIVDWAVQMVGTTDTYSYIAACDALAAFDVRAELTRISVPTLVIVGAEDTTTPPADARVLVAGIHDAKLAVVPGASHLAPVEQPSAVTDLLVRHFTTAWQMSTQQGLSAVTGASPTQGTAGAAGTTGAGGPAAGAPGAGFGAPGSGAGGAFGTGAPSGGPGTGTASAMPPGTGQDGTNPAFGAPGSGTGGAFGGPGAGAGFGAPGAADTGATPPGAGAGFGAPGAGSAAPAPGMPAPAGPGASGPGGPGASGTGFGSVGRGPGAQDAAGPGASGSGAGTSGSTGTGTGAGAGPVGQGAGAYEPVGSGASGPGAPGGIPGPAPAGGGFGAVGLPAPGAGLPGMAFGAPGGGSAAPGAGAPRGFGPPPADMHGPADDRERGERIRREVLGDEPVDRDGFTGDFHDLVTRSAWGGAWSRPGLDRRTRALITLTALTARGHVDEIAPYTRGALRSGVTPDEIKETLLHTAVYCGLPAAGAAFAAAQRVIAEEAGSGA